MFGRGGHGRELEDRDLRRLDRDLRKIVIEERESYASELRAELTREHGRLRDMHRSRHPRRRLVRAAAMVLLFLSGSLAFPGVRTGISRLLQPDNSVAEAPDASETVPRVNPPMVRQPSSAATAQREPQLPSTLANPDERPIRTPVPVTLPSLMDRDGARMTVAQEYPAVLQRRGIGGRVGLLMWVREDGTVEFPQVESTSGVRELDLAALRATQSLSFAPATRLGDPVGTWVSFSIRFQPVGAEVARSDSGDGGFHIALSN